MSEERFWSLVNQLRENYRVGAHTSGPCSNNDCTNSSDGGGKCALCCGLELAKLTGEYALAQMLISNTRDRQRILNRMLESLKDAG